MTAKAAPCDALRSEVHVLRLEGSLALSVLLALGACSGRERTPVRPWSAENTAAGCSDGIDNDGDSLVDCLDSGCSSQPFCPVDASVPVDLGERPDYGPTPLCMAPIDVAFVVDVSTSMADDLGRVRTGLRSIYDAAQALTTETQFSLVVFVDNAVAEAGCAPFASVADMEAAFDRWRSFCSTNGQPGGGNANSDCAENSLDALYLAAMVCPWRTGATRIVIHVTDDTFAERPATLSGSGFGGDGIAVNHTYDEVVTALRSQEVRVGAFAAPGAGEECGAGVSANVGRGFHEPYSGRDSIPIATGGRAWSIRDVRAGTLDMAAAINEMVTAEYCTLY
jgi:hypothetical protein